MATRYETQFAGRRPGCWFALGIALACWLPGPPAFAGDEPGGDLRNPLPRSPEVVERGRKSYLRLCSSCHGQDGRSLDNIDGIATDLTDPDGWRFGSTDADLRRSIEQGAGDDMPPFRDRLNEAQAWELVHYVQSLWPAERPSPAAPPPGRAR